MKNVLIFMFGLSLFFGLSSCARKQMGGEYGKIDFEEVTGNFEPLPKFIIDPKVKINKARISLGKKLYFDKRLSKANNISCNSCHKLGKFGVDGNPTSPGHKGQLGGRNSPTVYNAGLHLAQFWDGRAADLAEQAKGPILNPVEMAMPNAAAVMKRVKRNKRYRKMFKNAFPKSKDPMTYENLGLAIGAFEANLLTPSRFDTYLSGKQDALTKDEKEGLKTFMNVGCVDCHNGVAIGGGQYQKYGLEVPVPGLKDKGRFEITKDADDMYVFKVPSLRNIVKTGPYSHNGSVKDLNEMVRLMGKHQLGKDLTKAQVKSIVEFLKTLTGRLPNIRSM